MALQDITKQLIEKRQKQFTGPRLTQADLDFLSADLNIQLPPIDQFPDIDYNRGPFNIGPVHRSAQKRLGPLYNPLYEADINEQLAQEQSVVQRLAYFLPRVGTKVLSEVAQIPGYIGGLTDWATTGFKPEEIGRMVDNEWVNAIKDKEDQIKDLFPVFTPKAVQEGTLWDNITSASFWANEGADGVGFLLSMLVPGQVLRATKAGPALAKLPKLIKPGQQIFTKGPSLAKGALTSARTGAFMDDFLAALVNTFYEAGVESGETFRDVEKLTGDKMQAGEAAVGVFKNNLGILLGPNILTQMWLFNGFKAMRGNVNPVAKAAERRMLGRLMTPEGDLLSEVATRTPWSKIGVTTRKALQGVVSEGFFEEGLQFSSSEYQKQRILKGKEDPRLFGEIMGLIDTYASSLKDVEMQKNILLGAVLGGGMTTVAGIREVRGEERLLKGQPERKTTAWQRFIGMKDRPEAPGLHTLLQRNLTTRYQVLQDIAERDANGDIVYETINGRKQMKLDPKKAKEFLASNLHTEIQKQMLREFAESGEKEGFELIKTFFDFNYMYPFLQQQGGQELLKHHINALAKMDAEKLKETIGEIESTEVEEIRQGLLGKAERFQKIYDDISDTHDVNLRVPHDSEDNERFREFSEKLKSDKMSESIRMDHTNRRITVLTDELRSFEKGGQSLPVETEADVNRYLTEKKIDKNDATLLNKKLSDIEAHKKIFEEAREKMNNLMNNATQKRLWQEELDDYKRTQKAEEDAADMIKKDRDAIGLGPKLKNLYDSATAHETLKLKGEEYDAFHSADIELSFVNQRGEPQKLTAIIADRTGTEASGSLLLRDKQSNSIIELREDETFRFKGEDYKLTTPPKIVKPVDRVIQERQSQALMDILDSAINYYRNTVQDIENRLEKGFEYVADLQERANKLVEKEIESAKQTGSRLTRKGKERVESVMIRRRSGSIIVQMYLTTQQIRDELAKADSRINALVASREKFVDRLKELEEQREHSEKFEHLAKQEFDEAVDLIAEKLADVEDKVAASKQMVDTSDKFVIRMQGILKGYHTTMAGILNMRERLIRIRESDLTPEEKEDAELEMLSHALEIQQASLSDTELEELGAITHNELNILDKLRVWPAEHSELIQTHNKLLQQLSDLKQQIWESQKILQNMEKYYVRKLSDLGIAQSITDLQTKKSLTPEERLETLFKDEANRLEAFEEEARHPFTSASSWLYSTGNQNQAVDNDDVARWYVFVNNLAYKEDKNHSNKYVYKNISYDIVSKLEPNHVLRKQLTFWTGEENGLKTYDQIQDLSTEEQEEAREDIKMVVYEATKLESPLMVGNAGSIDVDQRNRIVFSSFPLATETTSVLGKERFSLKQLKFTIQEELGIKEPTEEQITQIEEIANTRFEQSRKDYEEAREILKEKVHVFKLSSINPGVKNYDNADSIEVLKATGIKHVNQLSFKLETANKVEDYDNEFKVNVSGFTHTARTGFLYVYYNNHIEAVKPKTFGETNSVDYVVDLLRYLAQNTGQRKEYIAVEKYLREIMYWNFTNDQYRIVPLRPLDKKGEKIRTDFTGFLFGEHGSVVSKEQLLTNQGLEELKEFLKNKYWNFNKEVLGKNRYTYFDTKRRGDKITVDAKTITGQQGGYKGFLFGGANGLPVKGTIYVAPRAKNNFLAVKENPQYKNQSIQLIEVEDALHVPGSRRTTSSQPSQAPIEDKKVGSFAAKFNKDNTKDSSKPQQTRERKVGSFAAKFNKNTSTTQQQPEQPTESSSTGKIDLTQNPAEQSSSYIEEPTGLTMESYWEGLKKSTKESDHKVVDFFLKNSTNEAEAMRRAWDAEQMGNLDRVANIKETYEREDLNAKKQWFKEKFPDFPIYVVEGLVDDIAWGQFNKGARVLISDIAADGTVYHESFHVVSQIFLTQEERDSLYNETRGRLNKKDATDKEIEEILAEEFREYMQSEGNYNFAEAKIQKNLFQKIWEWIKKFFGIEINNAREASELFAKIESDTFRLSERKSYTEETYNSLLPGFESSSEQVAAIQDVNYQFFNYIFKHLDNDETVEFLIHPQTDRELHEIYDHIRVKYNDSYQSIALKQNKDPETFEHIHKKIVDNWPQIIKFHADFLLQYQIDIRPEITQEIDEDNRVKDILTFKESNEIDLKLISNKAVRMVIAGLPSVVRVADSKYTKNLSAFKTYSNVAYGRIMNLLMNELAKSSDFDDMTKKLLRLADKYPEIYTLIRRIGLLNEKPSRTQVLLQAAFFQTFSHNRTNPVILIFSGGGVKYFLNSVDNTEDEVIRGEWLNKARDASNVVKNKQGEYIVKIGEVLKQITAASKLKGANELKTAYLDLLGSLGIEISPYYDDVNNIDIIKDYFRFMVYSLKKAMKTDKEIKVSELYNRDVVKNQNEVRQLINYSKTFRINDVDLMYFNQDGKPEWSITLNHSVSKTVNRLNALYDENTGEFKITPDTAYLMLYDEKRGRGNLFATNSYWIELLKEGNKLNLTLLRAAKPEQGRGRESSILTKGDFKSLSFKALLDNYVPLLRAAERKLENAIKVEDTNWKLTKNMFVARARGYLEDELLTSFALITSHPDYQGSYEFGWNLANYREQGRKLRTFSYLKDIPTPEEFIGRKVGKNRKNPVELKRLKELVKEYITEYNTQINKGIGGHIENTIERNLQSLEEDGLIYRKQIAGGSNYRYGLPGLDLEQLIKSGVIFPDSMDKISEAEMKHIAMVASYNMFVGAQEQLRLFFGDLAMYETAIEFHKRTTGALSTKYDTMNTSTFLRDMDRLYPRFDGQVHSKLVDKLVYKDIITSNKELAKIYPKYNKINGVDAQAWILPDEYRSLFVRNGQWGNKERTYQYEMQHLALRLLKNENLRKHFDIDESVFTEEGSVFYEHTNGKVPQVPMYKGEEIDVRDLQALPPIKPQGFGYIDEAFGLFAPQMYKLSAAPVFPSLLKDDNPMLIHMLQMMNEGIGMFGFVSADKATHKIDPETGATASLEDEAGNVNAVDVNEKQSIDYDHFGIQLDIHDESNGRVTISRQRTKLEYLDIFNKGIPVKGKEHLQEKYNEYKRVTKEILNRQRTSLLREIGLTKQEDGTYKLTDENKEKFKERLHKAFRFRMMSDNAINGIDLSLDTAEEVFDAVVNKNQVEHVLIALINNRVINRQTHGEMFVQESSYIYNEDLKFYTRQEDGSVSYMEAIVPLPREWLGWVDSLGGIDVFNELISDLESSNKNKAINAKKILGNTFNNLLTFSANRIPSQGLNSLEAVKVKKFFPYYVGHKIAVPAELTVKAGSDFDIDKLTSYLKYFDMSTGRPVYKGFMDEKGTTIEKRLTIFVEDYFKEDLKDLSEKEYKEVVARLKDQIRDEFNSWNIEQQQSLPALENRLNELAEESLLDPARYEELIRPNDTSTLDSLVVRQEQPQLYDLIQWWYNVERADNFWRGKTTVSLAAIQNTAHAVTQSNPVRIDNPLVKIFFPGQNLSTGQNYTVGQMEDAEGHPIGQVFGEFLSAFVDIVKNPDLPTKLNSGIKTFPIYAFLLRTGIDNSVGLNSVFKFITQPVILDYLKKVNIATSQFIRNSHYFEQEKHDVPFHKYKTHVSSSMLLNLSQGLKNVPTEYNETLASTFLAYFSTNPGSKQREEVRELLEKRIQKYNYKNLTGEVLNKKKLTAKEQIQVLDNYLMYEVFSYQLNELNKLSRPDTKLSGTIDEVEWSLENLQRLKDSDFFNHEDLDNLANNSIITGFRETREDIPKAYAWAFISKKLPNVKVFFESWFQELNPRDREDIMKAIEDDFIVFIGEGMPHFDTGYEALQNDFKQIMTGENSVASILWQLKNSKLGQYNEALKELEPIFNQLITARGRYSDIHNISLYNRRHDVFSENSMTWAIKELMDHPNKNVVNYVSRLIKQAFYQSGMSPSALSYLHIIPNEKFVTPISDAIHKFAGLSDDVQIELLRSFREQFYRNNWDNLDVIPRSRKTRYGDPRGVVSQEYIQGNLRNESFITIRHSTLKKAPAAIKFRKGLRVASEVYLYKRDDYGDYQLVSKLGDGIRFKEYYPAPLDDILNMNVKSILPVNSYEFGGITRVTDLEQTASTQETTPTLEDEIGDITLDEINKQMGEASEKGTPRQEYALKNDTSLQLPVSKELNDAMEDFLNALGVSVESVDIITDHTGEVIPKAVAVAKLSEMTVQVINKELHLSHLPEEAAHWYVSMLGEDSNLYKSMIRQIDKYGIYNDVKADYSELYENDENRIRREAVGKLIAQHIVQIYNPELSDRQQMQVKNWWAALWNFIQKLFGIQNKYARAAYNIMNKEFADLRLNATKIESETLYALESRNWNELEADKTIGNIKYKYFRNPAEAEAYFEQAKKIFGEANVNMISTLVDKQYSNKVSIKNPHGFTKPIANKTVLAEHNMNELGKETSDVGRDEIFTNFEKYYPALDYLDDVEKEAFVDALSLGEIEQVCGL